MYSSFVSHKSAHLNIVGDNLGYWAGKHFGPRLLRWLDKRFHLQNDIKTATNLIRDHGEATIFWARYIFGLRTIAGPVAGTLKMEWKKFLLFNSLGAVSWIVAVSLTGFFFADKFKSLSGFIEKSPGPSQLLSLPLAISCGGKRRRKLGKLSTVKSAGNDVKSGPLE